MSSKELLSENEFKQMLSLMARYTETELDQFVSWKIGVPGRKIYIDISMAPAAEGAEEAYIDLSHLIT